MACLGRILSPVRVHISSIPHSSPYLSASRISFSSKIGLLKTCPNSLEPILHIHAPRSNLLHTIRRQLMQNLNLTGRKLLTGGFLGSSVVAGMMYHQSNAAYAMDDHRVDFREPSGILKDDVDNLWSLLKRFQLPAVLLITVLLGWRHPITLAINVTLLLICTRPSPSSIYVFIEQLRQRDMRQDPRLHKSKLLYVKKAVVKDYKLLYFAKVELREMVLDVIGVLGGWWVIQTSRTK